MQKEGGAALPLAPMMMDRPSLAFSTIVACIWATEKGTRESSWTGHSIVTALLGSTTWIEMAVGRRGRFCSLPVDCPPLLRRTGIEGDAHVVRRHGHDLRDLEDLLPERQEAREELRRSS